MLHEDMIMKIKLAEEAIKHWKTEKKCYPFLVSPKEFSELIDQAFE
jgi:hypothetical protein